MSFTPPSQEEVASRAEAWIETRDGESGRRLAGVASRAEAWIETEYLPRWRGTVWVASRAEAWIETLRPFGNLAGVLPRRLPCGGVD